MRCRPGLPPAAAERGTQAAAATAEHSLPLRWTRRRPLRSAGECGMRPRGCRGPFTGRGTPAWACAGVGREGRAAGQLLAWCGGGWKSGRMRALLMRMRLWAWALELYNSYMYRVEYWAWAKCIIGPNFGYLGYFGYPTSGTELTRLFYFYIFRKPFLQKYIFNITIYSFVPLPPGRGRQRACRPVAGRQGLICKF